MGRGESWWCSGGMGLWVVSFVWLLLLLLCVCVCVFSLSWWWHGFCGWCLVVFGDLCVCVCVCVCVFFFFFFLLVVAWFLWPVSGGIWWFVCMCVCVFLVGGLGGFFNGFASWHSGGVVVVAGWCLVG